jgi:hypothetical protein
LFGKVSCVFEKLRINGASKWSIGGKTGVGSKEEFRMRYSLSLARKLSKWKLATILRHAPDQTLDDMSTLLIVPHISKFFILILIV